MARPSPFVLAFALALVACRPEPRVDEPLLADEAGEASAGAGGTEAGAELPPRPPATIFRSELRRGTQDGSAAYLLGQLRPEAYRPQGRFEGWIIGAVWPGDPQLCAPGCDLELGDVILSVNGSKLEHPEELADAMAKLDALAQLEVRGMRGGEYFERTYAIASDPQ